MTTHFSKAIQCERVSHINSNAELKSSLIKVSPASALSKSSFVALIRAVLINDETRLSEIKISFF